eukprot:278996_1
MSTLQAKYDEYVSKYGSAPNATQFKKFAAIKYAEASKFVKTAVPMNTGRNRSISTMRTHPNVNTSPLKSLPIQTRGSSKSMIKPTAKRKPKATKTKPSHGTHKPSVQIASAAPPTNPYLDSIITSKFTSPTENQRFIKKHSKPPKHPLPPNTKVKSKVTNRKSHKGFHETNANKNGVTNPNTLHLKPQTLAPNSNEYIGRNRSQSVRMDTMETLHVNDNIPCASDGILSRQKSNSVPSIEINTINAPNLSSIVGCSNPYIDSSVASTFGTKKKLTITVEMDGRTRSESVRTDAKAMPPLPPLHHLSSTRTKSNSVPSKDGNSQIIEQNMDPKVKQFIDIAAGQKRTIQEHKVEEHEYDEDISTVILDNGSGTIKIGLGGSGDVHKPSHVFPSVIAYNNQMNEMRFGDQVSRGRHGHLFGEKVKRVIRRGNVVDWEQMEQIWNYGFDDKLRISPWNCDVLLTESVLRSNEEREKSVEVFFESLDVNSMYLQNEACLSLLAMGRLNGTVLGIGHDVTYSTSIFEGFCLPQSIIKIDCGGYDLTQYLAKVLDTPLSAHRNMKIMNEIKHKYCYCVTPNNNRNLKKEKVCHRYRLPDGGYITINEEDRHACCEKLFDGFEQTNDISHALDNKCGIQHMIRESIECVEDESIKQECYSNIVLSGGSTLFDGLPIRLREEMLSLVGIDADINIIANDKRKYLAWIGGSIVSSISQFRENFIQKEEYQEHGKTIVHSKCPS